MGMDLKEALKLQPIEKRRGLKGEKGLLKDPVARLVTTAT